MTGPATERLEFANTLRGIAALAVLLGHYLGVFWIDRSAVAALTLAPSLPASFGAPAYVDWLNSIPQFRWGQFGVAMFFLISGFVIPFSLLRMDARQFAITRFFRLYPTYAVGFTVSLAALGASAWWQGAAFQIDWATVASHYVIGTRDLLGKPTLDGVIWTLEVELKFYVICALAAPLLRNSSPWVFAIPAVLAALAFALPAFLDGARLWSAVVNLQFLVFMFIGVALHQFYRRALAAGPGSLIVATAFVAFWVIPLVVLPGAPTIQAVSGTAALVVFIACFALRDRFRATSLTSFFADVSYPLYVVHPILGYVLIRALLEAGIPASVAVATATAIVLASAYALHRIVERPSRERGREIAMSSALQARRAERTATSPDGRAPRR